MSTNSFEQMIADLSPVKRELLLKRLAERLGTQASSPPAGRAREAEHFPLSSGQRRLWFLQQLKPNSAAYNYPVSIHLRGRLDVAALERGISEIVRRQDALRTNFVKVEGQPVQRIRPHEPIRLRLFDLTTLDDAEREARAATLIADEAQRPFDLSGELLCRVTLLRLSDEHHILLLLMHHIVFDGWSLGLFLRELGILYDCFRRGLQNPLPELTFRYVDYAVWQQQTLRDERLEELLSYWKRQLAGAPALARLPADRPRPAAQTFRGAQQTLSLSAELSDRLRTLSRREGVTLFMTLLAAFKTLLYRSSGETDIIVGTDTANRSRVETEELIGFFVNIVPLRTDVSGNPTFLELLGRVREVALQAYAHEELPFDKLVEALCPERVPGYTPFVQVLFLLQNAPLARNTLAGLSMSMQETGKETTKFDLVVSVAETTDGLAWVFNYSTDIFEEATIARLMKRFRTLLGSIADCPEARLNDLEVLTETELRHKKMQTMERQGSKLQKLRSARRKGLDFSPQSLVKTSYLEPEGKLPLVLQPGVPDLDLAEWAASNRDYLEQELLKHGAILFRGFGVRSVAEFENAAAAACHELFGDYGDLPREAMGKKIYESTPYPPDQAILFHNESSHMHRWPTRQWFYCVVAAREGGETPIVDCRRIYQLLDPRLVERFERKRLMYVRNFIAGLDVTWQDFFKTTDRATVEEYCRAAGMEAEWKADNLRVRKVCPAVIRHPKTGEMSFFNQLQLHHVSTLAPEIRSSLLSMFREEDLPRNVYYGDGSPIEDSTVEEIIRLYWQTSVSFPWQEGDVLFVENMLTAHARSPFVGPRKIVVAMGDMINAADVERR
jgi:alpha-ketoglutarate-dependent taurine dioxygenase